MHGPMRRMPVERVPHHAKRLGHVLAGVGPAPNSGDTTTTTTTTTTTQQQSVSSTTSSHTPSPTTSVSASSSASPSSSTTQSSSATTSTTTSTSLPITTQSHTSDASSSSPIMSGIPTTSISPTPSQTTSQVNTAAGGLSGGSIAGIIAGGVIVGVALIVFFVRKTYLRRRERKRISWTGAPDLGTGAFDESKLPDTSERPAPPTSANSLQRGPPLSPYEPHARSMYSFPTSPGVNVQSPTFPAYVFPTPPPATYNNPVSFAPNLTQPAPPAVGSGDITGFAIPRASSTGPSINAPPARAQHASMEAIVKFSFVPTLPDELSITTGERIFIVEQYDDGWNLCANGRGERGMVPRECLESTPADQLPIGWRNVNRMSSLNSDGRRY